MAVQKSRKTPSKRGMHRSHSALAAPAVSIEPKSGETHSPHRISHHGFYRGKKVLQTKADASAGEDKAFNPAASELRTASSPLQITIDAKSVIVGPYASGP